MLLIDQLKGQPRTGHGTQQPKSYYLNHDLQKKFHTSLASFYLTALSHIIPIPGPQYLPSESWTTHLALTESTVEGVEGITTPTDQTPFLPTLARPFSPHLLLQHRVAHCELEASCCLSTRANEWGREEVLGCPTVFEAFLFIWNCQELQECQVYLC